MTTRQVKQAVGQPYTRLGSTYGICARTATDPRVMRVDFGRTAGSRTFAGELTPRRLISGF